MTETTITGKQHNNQVNKRMWCVTTTALTITAAAAAATTTQDTDAIYTVVF